MLRKPVSPTAPTTPACLSPLMRLIDPQVLVSDIYCSAMGDVTFRVDMPSVNLTRDVMIDDPLCQRRSFIDFVGVELVMRNLDQFAELMVSKKDIYEHMCYSYRHESFGLLVGTRHLELQFHISLLCWIMNHKLAGEIDSERQTRQKRIRTKRKNGVVVDRDRFIVVHQLVKYLNPRTFTFSALVSMSPDGSGLMRDIGNYINYGLRHIGERGISITLTQKSKSVLINLVRSFF